MKHAGDYVNDLSWSELNTLLKDCVDTDVLAVYLAASAKAGRRTRTLRIYGRYSAARRQRELKELHLAE